MLVGMIGRPQIDRDVPFCFPRECICIECNSACSYERERPARVKTIHVKGVDNATAEDRERYLYKPTFKPLWCAQVSPSYSQTGFLKLLLVAGRC